VNRPFVIQHNVMPVDARLTLSAHTLLLYGDPRWTAMMGGEADTYPRLMRDHQPQAFLEGSGSFCLEGEQPADLPPFGGDAAGLYHHYLPDEIVQQPNRRWMTVVDGRGRARWVYKEFPGAEWMGWYLLILVHRSTPADYLAYLQAEKIPYLVAGDTRVDLSAALAAMRTELGIERVVSTCGGALSGALLRAGLIDELDLELLPAAVGGKGTPALFDGAPLEDTQNPTRFELTSCQPQPDGRIRLRYTVKRETE
jgi:riboflavin biosynthesis pyrimidine reductase